MDARPVGLQKILNSNSQMIIPIFQREYSWRNEQVGTLWDDIKKLYKSVEKNGESITHFLGPIVRVDVSTSSVDTQKSYLIDGQQRIITLMVLLSRLRNILREINDNSSANKLEAMYLKNMEEHGENAFKLVPSEGDRENFRKIIRGEPIETLTESNLKDTLVYFNKHLPADSGTIDLEKLKQVIVKNLILVNIDVGKSENPYLIFESLNAKGTPLNQADLIRNYIFMRITEESEQKELYKEYWHPMEVLLGGDLERFFWRYTLKDGTFVKINRTYSNLKRELEAEDESVAVNELKKLNKYSVYYSKLIDPSKEENTSLRERIVRHNRWEIRTAYAFLLNMYNDYEDKGVSAKDFSQILDIIESFVVRRFFCKEPTNKLNRLFIGLYAKLDKSKYVESLKDKLKQDWPDDKQFKIGLATFPIYDSGREKCKLILETLEKSFEHKEHLNLSNIQIEHIMPEADGNPEKLPDAWKTMLGKENSLYRKVHKDYLHTLGNLTLTGYNPELAQKPFEEKKKIFTQSHFELNKYFAQLTLWRQEEILNRADTLANRMIKCYPRPIA
jgi:uncharacterized protein with ParB-like and HNH nuclease domain